VLPDKAKQSRLQVGIRPKDIRLAGGDAKSPHTRGRVKDIDTLGQTTVVLVVVGCLELKVKVATEDAPKREELVSLQLDTTKLHYFDADSGLRI
jgi:ABC-type sugar transport system ATPase subunit